MRSEKIFVFAGLFLLIVGLVSAGECPSDFKKYNPTICDGSTSEINIITSQFWCSSEGVWKKEGTVSYPFLTSSLSEGEISCYQNETEIEKGSSSDCCPNGMKCLGSVLGETGYTMYCVDSSDDDYVNSCEDIKTESKCNNAYESVAEDEIETIYEDDSYCETVSYDTIKNCYTARTCKCAWYDDDEECGTYVKQYGTCGEIGADCIEIVESVDESGCEQPGGYAKYTIKRVPSDISVPAGQCVSETKQISCSKLTRLGFFSWFNVIAVIMILGVIYFKKIRYEK